MNKKRQRFLAFALVLCMAFTALPSTAFAVSDACPHGHENCGYEAAVEGTPCSVEAAHVHDAACGYAEAKAESQESPCNHVHDEVCVGLSDATSCTHVHDDTCGYAAAAPAVEGAPCAFAHVHDDTCGYVEAKEAVPCTVECDVCGTPAAAPEPAALLLAGAAVPAASVSFTRPNFSIEYWEPLAPSLNYYLSGFVKVLAAEGSDATDQSVTWASNNPEITVDQAGVLTYKKADQRATITVITTDGGFKASCEVHVWVPGTEVVDATFSVGNANEPERRYDYLILSQNPNEVALVGCVRDNSVTNPDPFKIEGSVTHPVSGNVYKVVYIGSPYKNVFINSAVDYKSDLVIPDSVRYIGKQVFMGAPMKSITFGAGLTEIGEDAFQFCLSLETIDFSKAASLEKIGTRAFDGSYALKGPVVLPDSVKTFGAIPFTCVNLAGYLSIPKGAALTEDRIFTFGQFDVGKDAGYVVVDAPDITLNAGDAATGRDPYGFTSHTVFRSPDQIAANIPEPEMNALGISMDYSGFDGSTLPGVYSIPLLGNGNTTCPKGLKPSDDEAKQIFKEYSIVVRRGTVTVNPVPPTITVTPATQTVGAGSDATITATVPARDKTALHGKNYTLQWQRWNGADWEDVGAPVTKPNSAVAEASYTLSGATNADNGARFRCKVEDAYGAAISTEATVLVGAPDPVGSLTVSKTVAGRGGDTSKYFTFTVTFDNGGTYSYTGSKTGTIKSGDSITLRHGQSVTVLGLPAGISYSVTEAEANRGGYTTSSTGARGKIAANNTAVAAFVNDRAGGWADDPEPTGSLTVSKTVTGGAGDRKQGFTFVITFDSEKNFPYTGSKTGTIKSGDSVVLTHGQSITVLGLPAGISYSVTEAEANRGGYTTSSTGARGKTVDGTVTASFTNSKPNAAPAGAETPSNPEETAPQTGDSFDPFLWLTLLALSGAGLFLAVFSHKRRRNE